MSGREVEREGTGGVVKLETQKKIPGLVYGLEKFYGRFVGWSSGKKREEPGKPGIERIQRKSGDQ